MQNLSNAELLALLPEWQRIELINSTSLEVLASLEHDWEWTARPNQLSPKGEWKTWLALCGRGYGKTEAGAQWVRQRVKEGAKSIALVAETQKDLEEVMVARLLAISPPDEKPKVRYKPVRLTWPNGAQALGYNGTEPNQLRGPEFDTAWVDELAKYRYARETWDMLQFTMRKGDRPRIFVTTTPRRSNSALLKEIRDAKDTHITRGSTFENASNIPENFLDSMRVKYDGTRLGRQELYAEILDDIPGALWTRTNILTGPAPELQRIVVAVDPSGTSGEDTGDSVGIVIAGKGIDGRFYVLEDATCHLGPSGWGNRTVDKYRQYLADLIVAEKNFGGDMVKHVIQTADRNAPVKLVTASRGKSVRAEPIAALYEQNRVTHCQEFAELEDQMTQMTSSGFEGEGSPDRVDALVWALTELMLERNASIGEINLTGIC